MLYALYFFFNDTATTEIYTLSLHDALPISAGSSPVVSRSNTTNDRSDRAVRSRSDPAGRSSDGGVGRGSKKPPPSIDRKSTRLNSSHANISYAVFCLKKKNPNIHLYTHPSA